MRLLTIATLPLFLICSLSFAQEYPDGKSGLHPELQPYVKYNTSKLAITGVKVINGTGTNSKDDQTILIAGNKIKDIGDDKTIKIPDDYFILNLNGRTVIPGIVGTHNHMRLPNGAMLSTSPKLYLACGVTTIQTCGTINPEEEIGIGQAIESGRLPGPEIINSGPYLTGINGKQNFIRFSDKDMISDTIRYWANRGVKWFKVYRNTNPQELKIIIDEAHKNNAKVTGHLCATTYAEAAELGIDAIEHGFIHSYDHAKGKESGTCSGTTDFRANTDINSKEVIEVQQTLIDNNVAISTTLAIFETQARGQADQRSLDALAPFRRSAYDDWYKRKVEKGQDWYFKESWLKKSLQYDLAFFKAGGLLTAGLDPGLHNLPGYGDQKNYELFIEGKFTPEEAIQVMTLNGAKLLGRSDIGSIEKGKTANLVVLNGDLEKDPTIIRNVEIVFKNGIGYDSEKLINSIEGNVGSRNDNLMTYFGQKEPTNKPELFAPNLISKPDRQEFGCAFSKDGNEFFFAEDNGIKNLIYHSKLKQGVWTEPVELFQNDSFSYNDPMLSPDENRLYFISNRSLDGSKNKKDIDIWYAERIGEGWSAPINAGPMINTPLNEYFVSFTESGTLYFATKVDDGTQYNYDIVYSEYKNGEYQEPKKLPAAINTNRYEADVFVAPDESYIIFCAIRKDGFGQGDLYISFKNSDGTWATAVNMGTEINSQNYEYCPFVTKDGKYLFYTSNQDIYWMSAEILGNFKSNAGNK